MKKILFCIIIVLTMSLTFVVCFSFIDFSKFFEHSGSACAATMKLISCTDSTAERDKEFFKTLKVIYDMADDKNLFSKYCVVDCATAINEFFFNQSRKGFIAEIAPIEYAFYYTITKDDFSGVYTVGGYAECKCEILNISQKFNMSEYLENEITVRQKIYLLSKDVDYSTNMLEAIGATYKNEFGEMEAIEGVYKIPDKFINEDKFSLRVNGETQVLNGDGTYYSLIYFDNNIPCFYSVCGGQDECDPEIPSELNRRIINFKNFLLENYPYMLTQNARADG